MYCKHCGVLIVAYHMEGMVIGYTDFANSDYCEGKDFTPHEPLEDALV